MLLQQQQLSCLLSWVGLKVLLKVLQPLSASAAALQLQEEAWVRKKRAQGVFYLRS